MAPAAVDAAAHLAGPGASDARHYEGRDLEALVDLRRYQGWLVDRVAPYLGPRTVEIGAGLGSLALRYADRVQELLLVEPARTLVPELRRRVAGLPQVRVAEGLLSDLLGRSVEGFALEPGSVDSVLLVNVLEHVADDVALLRAARTLLRPGGHAIVYVPALPVLYGSLDRLVGHHRRYLRDSLEAAMRAAGLTPSETRYMDAAGILPWFVSGRLLRARAFSRRQAELYDRLVVPVTTFLEGLHPPPVGKNLLCVARPTPGPA